MQVQKIAAFTAGATGGNPAGVVISTKFPNDAEMQRMSAEIGYSETVFAIPSNIGWRIRYFSPETEVPFCGHATIALGAALALKLGNGTFALTTNEAKVTVSAERQGNLFWAALQSPPTSSRVATDPLVAEALALFGYSQNDLDLRIPPAIVHGGADHLLLGLKTRAKLSAMRYDLDQGRVLMRREGLATILFTYSETAQLFHTRNPFASGGVYEDPATGAAAAALGGYLRDIGWSHEGVIDIVQGRDMGTECHLQASISNLIGSSVRVSGTARIIS